MKTKLLILLLLLSTGAYPQTNRVNVIGRQYAESASSGTGSVFVIGRTTESAYDSSASEIWAYDMMESYVSRNDNYTYSQAQKDTIYNRLLETYVDTTFGPEGLNKTVCDFFLYFENSNTTTNLGARTSSKTGATLRWNYGNAVYSQNNLPAGVTNGVVTVTSADGFSGFKTLDLNTNTFKGPLPRLSLLTGLTRCYVNVNAFEGTQPNPLHAGYVQIALNTNKLTGSIADWVLPASLTVLNVSSNYFTGDLTSWALGDFLTTFNISSDATTYINNFTGTDISDWNFSSTLTAFSCSRTNTSGNFDGMTTIAQTFNPYQNWGIMGKVPAFKAAVSHTISGKYTRMDGFTYPIQGQITSIDMRRAALSHYQIDSLFNLMKIYFKSTAPTINTTVQLAETGNIDGFPNAGLTNGILNVDYIALKDTVFPAASKTFTSLFDTYQVGKDTGCVIFTFDDGYDSVYIHRDVFDSVGVTPTIYMAANYITNHTYNASYGYAMSWPNVLTLYGNGWDIQGHTVNHGWTLGAEEQDLIAEADTFVAHGLPEPEHLAYPSGSYTAARIAAVRAQRKTGRSVDKGYTGAISDTTILKCNTLDIGTGFNSLTDLDQMKGAVDVANHDGLTLIFLIHGMPHVQTGNHITDTQVAELITYIKTKPKLKIKSIKQWYDWGRK